MGTITTQHATGFAVGLGVSAAAFYFYKLVDSCAECHSAYARERFPGFREEAETGHHHH